MKWTWCYRLHFWLGVEGDGVIKQSPGKCIEKDLDSGLFIVLFGNTLKSLWQTQPFLGRLLKICSPNKQNLAEIWQVVGSVVLFGFRN